MNHNLHIKLSKGNFMAWKTQILDYIKGQDANRFIDGSSPPPQTIPNPSTDAGAPATIVNPDYLVWCQKDQMIVNVLISTLTVGCATSSTLWKTLLTMFASQVRARVMQIYFQLATVNKGNSSITEYFQTIKTLSDTLAAASQPLNDFESVLFLLKGLGSEYDPFVISVTTQVDPLSIDELYGHLLAHEMHLEQQIPALDIQQPTANLSTRAPMSRGRGYCGHGGQPYNRGRDSTTIVVVVPISLMMLLPLPNLHARFVESLDTQPFAVIKGRNPLPSLTLRKLLHRLITLLRFCQLRTLGTPILGLPIISPTSSSISICHMRIIPVRIKSV
jgi:hypothetical protein